MDTDSQLVNFYLLQQWRTACRYEILLSFSSMTRSERTASANNISSFFTFFFSELLS